MVYKGPVVRIGVNELHVNDPEIFQDITKAGSKFLKEPEFYRGISFPASAIGLVDPSKHRIRRQVLAPAFSSKRLQEHAVMIQGKVEKLCDRFVKSSRPINIDAAFRALPWMLFRRLSLDRLLVL